MSQPGPEGYSADILRRADSHGEFGEADGSARMPGGMAGSGWRWPGRAIDMMRVWCGVERYVVDSSKSIPHVAWAVGSAGLLSAGLFFLMKRAKLFPWTK